MPKFSNGHVPDWALVKIDSGYDKNGYYEFLGSPGILARWEALKAYCQRKWGVRPYIRTGWNIYRPIEIQREARIRACKEGNCLGAAYPGTSSHGGTWRGGDALAIDVEPGNLSWAQIFEAGRAVGFLCGAITGQVAGGLDEPWHIIDQDPWRAVPAGGDSRPFPEQEEPSKEERDDMNIIAGPNGAQKFADEFGADDIALFFYAPEGGPSWSQNIHAAWFLDHGNPDTPPTATTADQWTYDLARHQANARWDLKRGQIVTDTVNALKPLFAAISPLDKETFERLLAEGLASVVVEAPEVSEEDKAEIAALAAEATREKFRTDPLK